MAKFDLSLDRVLGSDNTHIVAEALGGFETIELSLEVTEPRTVVRGLQVVSVTYKLGLFFPTFQGR